VNHLHSNENTCVRAFFDLSSKKPLRLFEITQKGTRLFEFKERKKVYWFDPNRMFSKERIIKN
jgi:hypothetical protein